MSAHPSLPELAASGRASERSDATAMPPLDAWLYRHQSSGAVCMTAGVLARFEGPAPALPRLRELARQRWRAYERLRLTPGVPAAGGPDAWPHWTTGPAFDPGHHVPASPSPAPLEARTAQLLAHPLGPAMPPWQLHLLPAADGFALLLRAHHALLDGGSLVALLRSLLDAPAGVPGPRARPGTAQPSAVPRLPSARALADLLPRARPLPFHGPVDSRRSVAWCRIPAAELSAARDALPSGRASANAVFLAAAAGALRASGATGRLPLLPGVCAMVPVDVREGGAAAVLGNHYATVRVPLPTGATAQRRLAAVDAFTRRAALKQRARAQALFVSSRPRRHGPVSDALGRYADSPFYSSVLCSSLATYAGPLALGSARLTGIAALPPLSPGQPVAMTMAVHDTGATVTVMTDQGHRHLGVRLSALIRQEIRGLSG
ncbi:wax ester/triacylglycerol synthase domain-containing protein [Streptomyces sp. NPDC026206]|uniref:wax ester/triacylglycerol synthase domain-containing protein n=1 Tax=Streptomyces sp. NPDC026206 TaxID=3157089 RepID=UPI0033CA491B